MVAIECWLPANALAGSIHVCAAAFASVDDSRPCSGSCSSHLHWLKGFVFDAMTMCPWISLVDLIQDQCRRKSEAYCPLSELVVEMARADEDLMLGLPAGIRKNLFNNIFRIT